MPWSPRRILFRLYWVARDVLAPGLRYSQDWYEEELCRVVTAQTRWLDAGCGHQVLPDWRLIAERELVGRAAQVTGLDPDTNAVAKHRSISNIHVGTLEMLPFADGSFDLVTANMVVEHLADPVTAFKEVFRVLVPGGIFLFHTPNLSSYVIALARRFPDWVKQAAAQLLEGRKCEDVYTTHYQCNSQTAIYEIASTSGFEVASIRLVATDALFALVLPLALIELLWIRTTMRKEMSSHRTNIIAALRKPKL